MRNSEKTFISWEAAVEVARGSSDYRNLVELCYYDDPIQKSARRFAESEEWCAIRDLIGVRPGLAVLEIGAGRGILVWAFAQAGCLVSAVEPNPSITVGAGALADLFSTTATSVNLSVKAGERLEFQSDSFDVVVCRGVLHHVEDLEQVCGEAYRVLKPGGKFLAIKEHVADSALELQKFLDSHPLHHLYGGENAYPLHRYLSSLRSAGFAKIRKFGQFSHAVSSAPAMSEAALREKLAMAVRERMGSRMGGWVSQNSSALKLYRHWLTFRCSTPGRLYSFLAEKPR